MGLFGLFSKKDKKGDIKAKGSARKNAVDDDGQAKYLKDPEPTPATPSKAEPKAAKPTAPAKAEPKAAKPTAPA